VVGDGDLSDHNRDVGGRGEGAMCTQGSRQIWKSWLRRGVELDATDELVRRTNPNQKR